MGFHKPAGCATIFGALLGGMLMQKLTLFRALLIFGILQGVSNAGYWLLSVTDKDMITMASAVFFENLCGGMGTAGSWQRHRPAYKAQSTVKSARHCCGQRSRAAAQRRHVPDS